MGEKWSNAVNIGSYENKRHNSIYIYVGPTYSYCGPWSSD